MQPGTEGERAAPCASPRRGGPGGGRRGRGQGRPGAGAEPSAPPRCHVDAVAEHTRLCGTGGQCLCTPSESLNKKNPNLKNYAF